MPARYLVPGGTGNWNSTTNWAATSGGASGASFPIAGDTVFMDANSLGTAINVNVAAACLTLDGTNYTGTLTYTNALTVSGSVTYGGGMTTAGTGTLVVNVTGTLTSNGVVHAGNLTFAGATQTFTLADNWNVTRTISQGAGASGTVNGNNLYIGGGLTTGAAIADGTTVYHLVGTGTWSGAGSLRHPIVINSAGTITLGVITYGGPSITYIAGTIAGTGLLTISAVAAISLDTSGMTWPGGISLNSNSTITLLSDLNVAFLQHGGSTSSATWNGLFNINDSGSFVASLNTLIQGTATLVATGTGNWATLGATAQLRLNTTINTAGTITFGTSWKYNTGTFTYIAGTVVTTGNTFTIGASTTLDTSGMIWNIISITVASTVTLLSDLSVLTLNVLGNLTFAGAFNATIANLAISNGSVANRTLILVAGQTYYVTSSMESTVGTNAARSLLRSSIGGVQANLILTSGVTQNNVYLNVTDIDSSLGATGWTVNGVITNSLNWNNTPLQAVTRICAVAP